MSNNLIIGTGGCGNKLLESFLTILDETLGLQSTYDGLFINSNVNEMKKLKHFNPSINGLCINGSGTGRNPQKAKSSIKADRSKITNYLSSRAFNYDCIYILSSADGGFGNGSISILAGLLKSINKDIVINLLIAMPKVLSRRISLENSLDLYNSIKQWEDKENIKNGKSIINSVQFIDNSKMVEEDTFNEKTMRLFLESIELGSGALDPSDSLIVNSAFGYKVVLELKKVEYYNEDGEDESEVKDAKAIMQSAINASIQNSPFVLPTKLTCSHLAGVLIDEDFNKNTPIDLLNPKDFDKTDYGDKNILVLNGCSMPNSHIKHLEKTLEDLDKVEDNDTEDDENEEDIVIKTREVNRSNSNVNKKQPEPKSERERLKKLMQSESFWDE